MVTEYIFNRSYQFVEAEALTTSDIKQAASALIRFRFDQSFNHVTHIDIIAHHAAIAPNLYGLIAQHLAKKYCHNSLSTVWQLPLAVRIGHPEDAIIQTMHMMIQA